MPDSFTYEYAVIRIVPRVERDEFLNLGVILFCKRKRYLDVRYQLDAERLEAAFPGAIDLELLQKQLEAWKMVIDGDRKGGPIAQLALPERFRWLTAARSSILQCSPVHPGLCDAPEQVLFRLVKQYVG